MSAANVGRSGGGAKGIANVLLVGEITFAGLLTLTRGLPSFMNIKGSYGFSRGDWLIILGHLEGARAQEPPLALLPQGGMMASDMPKLTSHEPF